LSPKIANAYYLLGECQYNQNEYAPALESLKKSIELGGKSEFRAYAYHGIGWAYFQLGKYDEALQSFTPYDEDIREAPIRDSFLFGRARSLGS